MWCYYQGNIRARRDALVDPRALASCAVRDDVSNMETSQKGRGCSDISGSGVVVGAS